MDEFYNSFGFIVLSGSGLGSTSCLAIVFMNKPSVFPLPHRYHQFLTTSLTGFSLSYWSSCLTCWSMEATVPSHECRPASSSRMPSTQRIIFCRNSIELDGFSSHRTSGYMSRKMWVLSKVWFVFEGTTWCLHHCVQPYIGYCNNTANCDTYWQYNPVASFAS